MDLRLYFRVIWRFRLIVVAGLVLGLLLALLSYARVSFAGGKPSISYRQSETWRSTTQLFITQGGFPWGRTVLPYKTAQTPTGTQIVPSDFADPNRLSNLSYYYAQFANSDEVHQLVASRTRGIRGFVTAQALLDESTRFSLPFVDIQGRARTPQEATTLANAGATAFKDYMTRQQVAAGIPTVQRVTLSVTSRANGAVLVVGRRKTTPVVIFLTTMLAAIGLAFILENLRPRVQLVSGGANELDATNERRSA